MRGFNPYSHITLKTCVYMRLREKLKTLYLFITMPIVTKLVRKVTHPKDHPA